MSMTENVCSLLDNLTKHNSRAYGYELNQSEILQILKLFDSAKELEQYRAIGTIEEFKALKEKNETLKALYYDARKEGANLLANARAKATVELTDREREVLNTNLSAEIMKMQYHYGNSVPERMQVLYSLRDKLCHKEDK